MNRRSLSFLLPFLGVLTVETIAVLSGQDAAAPLSPPRASGLTLERLDSMIQLPAGIAALPPVPSPSDNPQTQAKINLGRTLFFDKNLSFDHSTSCATCHIPSKGFSDGLPRAVGLKRTKLRRRTPSLLNSAFNSTQFWDGRSSDFEKQALIPILAQNEMGIMTGEALVENLRKNPVYSRGFYQIFQRDVTLLDVTRAIAAFERTLVTPDSAFDRYASGDKHALTDPQKRGLILFIGKAGCSQCHNGPNFSDNQFHSLGSPPGREKDTDPGRFAVSKQVADLHAFKTPSLRNVTLQSYFMHNGSFSNLAQVVDFYDDGGGTGPKSKLLFKLHLTAAEQSDLLDFLNALNGRLPENLSQVP